MLLSRAIMACFLALLSHSVSCEQRNATWSIRKKATHESVSPVAIQMNSTLFIVGGKNGSDSFSTVYQSTDGVYWKKVADSPFSKRYGHSVSLLNDSILVCGGYSWDGFPQNLTFYNDVLYSFDGAVWERMPQPDWSQRAFHSVAVLNGVVYLAGGEGPGLKRDVWSLTTLGGKWARETDAAAWPARSHSAMSSHNGRLFLLAGTDYRQMFHDVWVSHNGRSWKQITAKSAFSARAGANLVSFSGSLWLLGGGLTDVSDIWKSTDGAHWSLVSSQAPWGASVLVGHAVSEDAVWIFGGNAVESHRTDKDPAHSPAPTEAASLDLNVWRSTDNLLCEDSNLVCFGHGVCAVESVRSEAARCSCDLDWTGTGCHEFISSGFWRDIGVWVAHHVKVVYPSVLGTLLFAFLITGVYLNHCRRSSPKPSTADSQSSEWDYPLLMDPHHPIGHPRIVNGAPALVGVAVPSSFATPMDIPDPANSRRYSAQHSTVDYDTFGEESPRTIGFAEAGINDDRPSFDTDLAYESEASLPVNMAHQGPREQRVQGMSSGKGAFSPASSYASANKTRDGSNVGVYLTPESDGERGRSSRWARPDVTMPRRSLLQSRSYEPTRGSGRQRPSRNREIKGRRLPQRTPLDHAASSYEVDTPLRRGYLSDSD